MHRRDGLVEMWDEACRTGMAHTAYGILFDLFTLWDALDGDPNAPVSPDQEVGFKEDLMRLLGDEDGRSLRHWKQLWESDRVVFRQRAIERIENLIGK